MYVRHKIYQEFYHGIVHIANEGPHIRFNGVYIYEELKT